MDRIREGSRRTGVSGGGGGGGPPPPRRRLRSSGGGGGGGGGGPRDSPRSERRRGERLMLNGGGRDDGDDTSDESLGDDDEDADEELAASAPRYPPVQRRSPSTAPPPSPPQPGGGHHHSSSSSGGGGGYHNHHHHGGQPQMQRKAGSNPKSPIVWKAADEMIGVPVPRKARSASTKRSSHEWSVPGGGSSGGGGGSGSGAGDTSQIQRPSSRPISPASGSTTGPARKKLKHLGGSGSSGGSGQAPKQRPSPASAPSTAPPQPPPPKISKSPSFIQEEIEVAEVLFGLTRQFPCPPKPVESNHKLEPRGDATEVKSGNSSPAPSSSVARPSDSTSVATIAPKRKRPRLVKYDDDVRPASPAKPDMAEPSSRPEPLPASRSEAKASVSAATDSGTTTATAGAQHEASREPEKREDHRIRDSELRAGESDRRDRRTESRPEPPAPAPSSSKPDGESAAVAPEARNGEATAATKIELASDGARQEKFCIDLMAPPPGKLSPDRDGASDPDVDKKGLDSEMDMVGRGNSEKKDGERPRRGLEINLEDDKVVQRILADELAPKKLTLQLDLEKPSLGDEKSPSERRPQPALQQQQQKPPKNEIKHEKSAMPAVTPPMPIPVGNWLGSFPPFSYLGPVPALSAAGLHHPMDVKPGSSAGLQHTTLLTPPPVRQKRCATHCFIAHQIQNYQRFAKVNLWQPAAAAAAAAAAGRSAAAPFFGPRPFSMGVVPPPEATSLLVNPMQGSYPVRAHTPLQDAKPPSMATSPFQGNLSKDKAAMNNAAVAETSQRKQPSVHEAQQPSPVPNMLQGPAFIFPFNQQQAAAAAVAAANAARVGDTKPSGGSNAMPPSAAVHTSAANPGATAMNLSFANLPPADAQFLAILQNGGYPFQVAAHAGGPPAYRGMAPPGPAVPFFNGHVYPSHMLHPSQQQGASQSVQKTPMSNMSTSSQKHQPQQSQGLLGYAPNANAAAAANNSQSYSSGNQRPVLLPGLAHRQDSEKAVQDGPSGDDKSSHHQKGGYDHHNYAVPVHLQNFTLMPPASAGGGSQGDKKLSDHHPQQLPPASRGQGVRIDLASSQPFVVPFGPPGSAPGGLDFSSLAPNTLFQSHQEAGRHSYPQLNFATAQSVQAGQHKPQHQVTGETKSVAGDSSTHNTVDSERKKSAAAKYPGDSQQHSLSFSRQDNKSYVPPFLSGSTNESSSRTLSLIGSEPSNAFSLGGKSANASAPATTSAAAPSPSSIPQQQQQQQQQQHFLQLHKHPQQLIPHHHLNSRPRSAAPSNTSGYSERLNMASFPGMMYPSGAAQGGVPSQSPQLKPSSTRATGTPGGVASPGAAPSNLIVMKNSGHHQQQAKTLQSLSTTNHQPQSSLNMSSSKMGPSVTNISTGGGDLSRSSNAPVASGSPSNSVSKSTGGSPPASGSAKGVPPSVQLPSPQQQSVKNPASTSGAKSTPTNHYSMPMPSILGQQPNVSPASNSGSKQQSHIPSLKQQPFPQGGHFFISNAYTPQAAGAAGGVALGLYQKRSADKTQQPSPHQQSAMSAASNNMKTLHPPAGNFMHLSAASQSASGVPHSHMSAAQLTFGAPMSMSVKPSSDQKPAAGK
ncbi:protein TIME FOR COFFEE isoform X2 [Oryza brachyantha]|uniref:protein TIME FOR COFFEE isoform X2 n=1 Tax=Oryza brachyantha TaxID=4533 RepID=UPI001AD969BB|nr:protein TIME FOR COFFEE isoform X2 [Oryza brachyantha]